MATPDRDVRLERTQGSELPLALRLRYRSNVGIIPVQAFTTAELRLNTTPTVKLPGSDLGDGRYEFATDNIKDWTGTFPYQCWVVENSEPWMIADGKIHSGPAIV